MAVTWKKLAFNDDTVLLNGRAGGQALYGGTDSGDDLTLYSTSHATKGIIKSLDDIFIDPTNNWDERNALLTIQQNIAVPTVLHHNFYSLIQGKGDNATLIGVCGGFFNVRDRADVTVGDKGLLYGLAITVGPIQDRINTPFDDVTCLCCSNSGSKKGTDAICIEPGFTGVGSEWVKAINIDADADYGISINGDYVLYGLDFAGGAATYGVAAIRIPNAVPINARNALNTDDLELIQLDASDGIYIGHGSHGVYLNGNNTGFNTSAFDATAVGAISIGNGTAPAAHVDNAVQIYSIDSSDATATLGLYTEQAVEAVGGGFTTSHKLKVLVNGTEYWIALDAV